MITLHVFGPAFGLPDPSPFVLKAHMLLKLAGLPYETKRGGLGKAPKGKLPFIVDDGTPVADSTFIRLHLESKHGIDFDKGLNAEKRGIAWAAEKMCEDHLYWGMVHERWMVDANFDRGPRGFFKRVPTPLRPLAVAIMRRRVRGRLEAHGLGKHGRAEIAALMIRGYGALSAILGDKPYLMGETPCGADATVFAWIAPALATNFESPVRDFIATQANLVSYRDRLMAHFFPENAGA